ncbi:hypothetical protein L2E82_51547 [Cichorium intybus]|nr:hypothetical protein L2E82_51547 [Cichorium intybus]
MRGDPHVRFGGRGYPDPTIIMPLQCYLKIAGRIEIRSFVRNKVAIGCTNSTDRRPSRCLWGRTDRLISSRDRRSTLANATREEAAKIPSLTNAPA